MAAVLAVAALAVFGRSAFGRWARYRASCEMDAWAISAALHWLDRADLVNPRDGATQLMRARCYRHLEQWRRRGDALDRAQKCGAPAEQLKCEQILGKIQTGELFEGAEDRLNELTQAGLSPHDIASAFISGCLARQKMDRAESLLAGWSADSPGEAHCHYVRGIYLWRTGDAQAALTEIKKTLAMQPRHELAKIAIAQLYLEQKQLVPALKTFAELADVNPDNDAVMAGLAQVLRRRGRLQDARKVLSNAARQPDPLPAVVVEMAQIELESEHYEEAEHWIEQLTARELANQDTLSAAGVTLAMLGETSRAKQAFDWIARDVAAVTRIHDLRQRLSIDPRDTTAAAAFQEVLKSLAKRSADENPLEAPMESESVPGRGEGPGWQLYDEHCSACHGANGNGKGRAARHVYPRPRDLRAEKMRLVSTRNGIPTIDDVKRVMRLGMPGTSMQPRDDLRDADLQQLAEVVLDMRRQGIRDQFVTMLQEDEEEIDEQEVREVVAIRTTPGEVVPQPKIGPADAASIELGKTLYVQQTCHSCHGENGVSDETTPMFDDKGRPVWPRDLVTEQFKGGNTPENVYLRILLGMPGSPHPANTNLTHDELVDMVHYCQSLGQEPKRSLTNHQRAIRAAMRPVLEPE